MSKTHSDNGEIAKDYQNFSDNLSIKYKEPDSWHVTCLYMGRSKAFLNHRIYKAFREGINLKININTLIYIPGKIITTPVFLENFDLIDNKFPHMTLMLGSYKAVDSNYVLKALFGENSSLAELYTAGKIKDSTYQIDKEIDDVKVDFNNKKRGIDIVEKVYLIKFKKEISLVGTTKINP